MMYQQNYHWGMHLTWWIIWFLFLFWVFASPYKIPGQKIKKGSPLDTLKKRFAAGEITDEEFAEKKRILQE